MTARSYLFVPADRPERFEKALGCGADAVIVDLEDAVAPGKEGRGARRARRVARRGARQRRRLASTASESPWFRDDLALCALPGVGAVMLPKAERAHDLEVVSEAARPCR